MVGRICRQKAPDVFVRMASEVQKEIRNAYFVIVGDVLEGAEEERIEVEDLADKLGVNLIITGWVNNPMDYMKHFDVGCLLSRWEGFGLAIPEYMLAGVPIVATKVDAIPYLITGGETGVLVEKDDWKMVANKVVELARDENLRSRMVENGQKTVRDRFDIKGGIGRTTFDLKFDCYPFPNAVPFFVTAGFSFGGDKLVKITGHSDKLAQLVSEGKQAGALTISSSPTASRTRLPPRQRTQYYHCFLSFLSAVLFQSFQSYKSPGLSTTAYMQYSYQPCPQYRLLCLFPNTATY